MITTVAPNAYPSDIGRPNPIGDAGKRDLAKLLRSYARLRPERAGLVDLAAMLCPAGPPCPADVGGVRPRPIDGLHFAGAGPGWVAAQLLPPLLGPPPAPPPPLVPGAGTREWARRPPGRCERPPVASEVGSAGRRVTGRYHHLTA